MRVGKVLKNRQHKVKTNKTAKHKASLKAKLNRAVKRTKSAKSTAKYFRS